MRYPFFTLVVIVINHINLFSQCIDRQKVKFGGDYGFIKYIFHCPTYSFAANGDTSKNWNILNDPIDIKQAPKKALEYKKVVEAEIKKYAGADFYSDLKFVDVEVVYPENFQEFKRRSDITQKSCLAKYFYHYQFKPDSITGYYIGIAINAHGQIISPFNFPSKKYYKPIDKNFTYCKLIDVARSVQKEIDPIKEISFEYDKLHKRFYWLVSRELVNQKEGVNKVNQVRIDAASLQNAKPVEGKVTIIY